MLAYAANRTAVAKGRPSPNAMLAIIVGHVAVIAAVMSAKMELPTRIIEPPIKIDFFHLDDPPPPNPVHSRNEQRPAKSTVTQTRQEVWTPPVSRDDAGSTPLPPNGGDTNAGAGTIPEHFDPIPLPPVRTGPRIATPPSELKPPYPLAKLASEEEAVLKFRLTIDEQGRVVGVDPIGRADAAFLAAARRHILAHWRYQPATEDGRPVGSSAIIVLHFQLDA